jgi:hypothetical protein
MTRRSADFESQPTLFYLRHSLHLQEPAISTDQLDFFYKNGLSYAQEMGNRPQTLYGIADSPIGLASWILDHDARSNITLYWLTNTASSSARLYWENKLAFFAARTSPSRLR